MQIPGKSRTSISSSDFKSRAPAAICGSLWIPLWASAGRRPDRQGSFGYLGDKDRKNMHPSASEDRACHEVPWGGKKERAPLNSKPHSIPAYVREAEKLHSTGCLTLATAAGA